MSPTHGTLVSKQVGDLRAQCMRGEALRSHPCRPAGRRIALIVFLLMCTGFRNANDFCLLWHLLDA